MMSWTKALGHRDRPIGDAVRQPSPCALPNAGADQYANTDNGLVAVVAFGNRFSAPVPAWVHGTTRDAGFLFVPTVALWHYIVAYLGGGSRLGSKSACGARRATPPWPANAAERSFSR